MSRWVFLHRVLFPLQPPLNGCTIFKCFYMTSFCIWPLSVFNPPPPSSICFFLRPIEIWFWGGKCIPGAPSCQVEGLGGVWGGGWQLILQQPSRSPKPSPPPFSAPFPPRMGAIFWWMVGTGMGEPENIDLANQPYCIRSHLKTSICLLLLPTKSLAGVLCYKTASLQGNVPCCCCISLIFF